jgi:uncharacterized protein (DUF305 family)
MKPPLRLLITAGLVILCETAGERVSLGAAAPMSGRSVETTHWYAGQAAPVEPKARPELVRQPYSAADVEFMAGMIPHHAQAILIAGWAASHGARPEIRVLCERMVIGQRDEIETMRNWLRDRGEIVPDANATHHRMKMNGVEHDMLMPGMLTPEELKQLDQARGAEWDRLFLTFMIRHHDGALKMVDELFKAYGALQDDDVYKLVSDMYADQQIEIERMQKMLAGLGKTQPQ